MGSKGKSLETYFAAAAKVGAQIEVHVDHPKSEYQRQSGVCYAGEAEYLVMGPEGAPARVCIPYAAIRWFRRMDDRI